MSSPERVECLEDTGVAGVALVDRAFGDHPEQVVREGAGETVTLPLETGDAPVVSITFRRYNRSPEGVRSVTDELFLLPTFGLHLVELNGPDGQLVRYQFGERTPPIGACFGSLGEELFRGVPVHERPALVCDRAESTLRRFGS